MSGGVKDFVKSSLAMSALIIAAVFGVAWIRCGYHPVIALTFELAALSFVITAMQRIMAALPFKHIAVRVPVEFAAICAVVLGAGAALGWFTAENWPMVFLYVGIVYAAGFFLDMAGVKRDVDQINRMLEKRRESDGTDAE